MNQGTQDLGMLGQRQGTPGWADNPMWAQDGW